MNHTVTMTVGLSNWSLYDDVQTKMSQYTHWQQRGRGNPSRGRGHHRPASQNSLGNDHEAHSTTSQRGGSSFRGRGRGCSRRGRGQHRGGNRGYHCSQGTPRDVSSSHHGHKDARGGRSISKPQQRFLDFPYIEHHETTRLLPQFQVMFILRGLPGSGKSTIADAILQQYRDHAIVCSADYYRYNKEGKYVWHEGMLQETHSKCQRRAEKFAALNKPVIIIDNTNVTRSDMETYIKLSNQYGYVVVLVEPRTPWKFQAQELTARNTHNVSYTKIRKKVEQYDEILPHYFGWFVSPADKNQLQTMAKDVLWKCLQIANFQHFLKTFSGHSYPKFTVHNALSYYSIKHSDRQDFYHVTACFSPRGKYLAGSPYHKSPAVEKALGQVSHVSIIGCVATNDTFSARVSLTKKQRELWMNDNQVGQQQRQRGRARRHDHSIEEMTKSFQHLPLDDSRKSSERPDHFTNASAHITLGTRRDISPVQAKYDVQTVVNYELSSCAFEEYTLQGNLGTVRKYSDSMWAVYFNKTRVVKVPVIFSGFYD